eukprot:scaffold22021_cov51-Attheya_sp.AAC.4
MKKYHEDDLQKVIQINSRVTVGINHGIKRNDPAADTLCPLFSSPGLYEPGRKATLPTRPTTPHWYQQLAVIHKMQSSEIEGLVMIKRDSGTKCIPNTSLP